MKIHFFVTFVAVNVTFFPQFLLGCIGIPRRYVDYPDMFLVLNSLSSLGSMFGTISVLLFMWVVCESLIVCRMPVFVGRRLTGRD